MQWGNTILLYKILQRGMKIITDESEKSLQDLLYSYFCTALDTKHHEQLRSAQWLNASYIQDYNKKTAVTSRLSKSVERR